jgi:hypothetical protein
MIFDPIEKWVEIDNEPWVLARLVVFSAKKHFHVEIDLVQKESHKILKHLATLYGFEDANEALRMGYVELKKKLTDAPKQSE